MKPTVEQEQALDAAASGISFKINAYAGSGKTSTLKLISKTLGSKQGLYLAFNKAIANEAKSKFPRNVLCKTFHSLAFQASPEFLTNKLSLPRLMPQNIARQFGLMPVEIALAKKPNFSERLSAWEQAIIIEKAVEIFCSSSEFDVEIKHVFQAKPDWCEDNSFLMFCQELLPACRTYWRMCIDPSTQLKISHSVYLKHWSLTKPELNTEYILFDEAQDADPIMLNLLSNQGAQVIFCGDRHQSIYGWRGAVNAMQSLNIPDIRLTKSFRFGQKVADVANLIMSNLLDERVPIVGNEAMDSTLGGTDEPDAYLVRTNAGAFTLALELAQEGRRPRIEMDTESLGQQMLDVKKLQSNMPVEKASSFFGFNSWDETISYVEANPKSDIGPLVKLVRGNGINRLINALKRVSPDGDCVVSTAHKSKGLEFGSVMLSDDFVWNEENKPNQLLMEEDEARLTYVAATRAMSNLDVGGLTPFFERLETLHHKRLQKN